MQDERYAKAKEWVLHCGVILREASVKNVGWSNKTSNRDIVSTYDARIEEYLLGKISKHFPCDAVVGEELGTNGEGRSVWYIDPIDGTANFVGQHRNFAVSVGFYQDGHYVFGLVLDVASNLLYHAYAGEGAWRNGVRIHARTSCPLPECFLYVPMLYPDILAPSDIHSRLLNVAAQVRAVRSLGSIALEMCILAEGKADIFIAIRSNPWDHNAARLILAEAGGAVCTLEGKELPINENSTVLACGDKVLLETIADVFRKQ